MVEKALSLYVLSAHTYMVLMHGKITPELMDYIASELLPLSHSGQSLSLLVAVGKRLYGGDKYLHVGSYMFRGQVCRQSLVTVLYIERLIPLN